jgi:hypothetical protein
MVAAFSPGQSRAGAHTRLTHTNPPVAEAGVGGYAEAVFVIFLGVSAVSIAYGTAAMFNLGGAGDALAAFYAMLPRWYPKAGNDRPGIIRAGGAVSLGFGLALLLVDLLRFR